mgnify:CR=1 FL=1
MGRRLLTLRGALALGLILLAALGALWALSAGSPGQVAVVEVDGTLTRRVELTALTEPVEETFTGRDGLTLTVRFAPEGAQVFRADCPDQVCVHTGPLTRTGEAAVCLPARVVLRLEGGTETAVDGVTG